MLGWQGFKQRLFNDLREHLIKDLKKELNYEIKLKIKDQTKADCEVAILELFNCLDDTKLEIIPGGRYFSNWKHETKTLTSKLKDKLIEVSAKKFENKYKSMVNEFIKGEEFIDKIIDRIKVKQLK